MYGMRLLTRGVQRVLCQRPLLAARQEISYLKPLTFRYAHSKKNDSDRTKAKETVKPTENKEEKKKDGGDKGKSKDSSGSYKNSDGSDGNLGYSPITMKIVQPVCGAAYTYADRNIKLGRQLSPCLSIYKKQLTSVLSISLRLTGLFLACCVWGLGLLGFFGTHTLAEWADKVAECDCKRSLVNAAKFVFVFPFVYHFVAGTRHMLWSLNIFLTKPEIYATGYIAIALTVLLTAAILGLDWGEDEKKTVVELPETKDTTNEQLLGEEQDDMEDQENEEERRMEEEELAKQGPEKVNYKKLKEELEAIDLKLKPKD